jgi:copper resistance protein B
MRARRAPWIVPWITPWLVGLFALLSVLPSQAAEAGHDDRAPFGMSMHDDMPIFHLLMEEFEYRAGDEGAFAWDGQAWYGNDTHRLWFKSEGEISDGRFEHGRHEILYDRPIATYFDLQAGLRADIDDDPGRGWLAFGVQGLAPNFFEVSATAYAGSNGRFAANAEASFDLLLSQRLILQPKAEIDFYSKKDASRGIGSGLSQIEAGLRLRYEITRKFAPYIGLAHERRYGSTKRFAIANGDDPNTLRFVIGVHAWI